MSSPLLPNNGYRPAEVMEFPLNWPCFILGVIVEKTINHPQCSLIFQASARPVPGWCATFCHIFKGAGFRYPQATFMGGFV